MTDKQKYLDFKQIKEETHVPFLLKFFRLDETILAKDGSDEMTGLCPLGDEPHGDKSSFSFNTKKKTFQCFACKKRGSVIDFFKDVMKVREGESLTLRTAAAALDQVNKSMADLVPTETKAQEQRPPANVVPINKKGSDNIASNAQEDHTEIDDKLIEAGVAAMARKLGHMQKVGGAFTIEDAKQLAMLKIGDLETDGASGYYLILLNSDDEYIDFLDATLIEDTAEMNKIIRKVLEVQTTKIILCSKMPKGKDVISISLTPKADKAFKSLMSTLGVEITEHIIISKFQVKALKVS